MAWLNATPKLPEGSKRAQRGGSSCLSRIEELKKDKISPPMPPNPAPHLINRLIEIGIAETGGMGPSTLSWREIGEWQRLTGVELEPWEARLIRDLSAAYIAEGRLAEDHNCPPPWRAAITQQARDADEARLRSVLG
ncbi:phage tail assembly chaperone [Sphingomonas ginkgonis]|nr:hypothetical protein [Sphingomonas ginkgonis]